MSRKSLILKNKKTEDDIINMLEFGNCICSNIETNFFMRLSCFRTLNFEHPRYLYLASSRQHFRGLRGFTPGFTPVDGEGWSAAQFPLRQT